MNNTDKKTDLLIKKLRNQKPELSDESLLTDNIMAQIRNQRERDKQTGHMNIIIDQTNATTNRRSLRVFMYMKVLSTVAAIFFLVLFFFQEKYDDMSFTSDNKEIGKTEISKIKPPCLVNEQYSFAEVYSCYVEYNKSKNKQTFINYISKIKNKSYENN